MKFPATTKTAAIFAARILLASTSPTLPPNDGPTPPRPDFSPIGFAASNPIGTTTGGDGANSTTIRVSTPSQLTTAVAGDHPTTILLDPVTFNLTSRLQIGSNKSLVGTGANTTITGAGLTIKSVSNVIVRNIGIRFIVGNDGITDRKSTRLNSSHSGESRMPSSA